MASDKPKVYIESSTISYLTARSTRNVVIEAKKELTRKWWELRDRFELFISKTVVEEIEGGDTKAAEARLEIIQDIPRLARNEAAETLAQILLRTGAIPAKAEADAAHIAYAAVYGMNFLITWNQKHIATDANRRFIEIILIQSGFFVPRLLTPEQHLFIMEVENGYNP